MDDQNLTKLDIRVSAARTLPPASKSGSMQRFRRNNRRYDYYPADEAAVAIAAVRKANPQFSARETIDYLVMQGFEATSGSQR